MLHNGVSRQGNEGPTPPPCVAGGLPDASREDRPALGAGPPGPGL